MENIYLFKTLIKKHGNVFKSWLCPNFLLLPKKSELPKIWGGCSLPRPPGPYPYALILIKHYGSFILKLFLPLTFTVFLRIQNTFRKIKVVWVICIMFRDQWIILFFKFPFCGDFSLHLHKMVQETSRNITQAENFQRHVFWNLLMLTSIHLIYRACWMGENTELWS